MYTEGYPRIRLPKWRDPEFPDDTSPSWQGRYVINDLQMLQKQRGLPPLANPYAPGRGHPTMRLSWWDKKQKKVRGVTICADVVMAPCQWNRLHPEARRLVPHRLLPPAILCSRLHEPTR